MRRTTNTPPGEQFQHPISANSPHSSSSRSVIKITDEKNPKKVDTSRPPDLSAYSFEIRNADRTIKRHRLPLIGSL
ncbi:hypothetical protein TNCV_3854981 [Trichonephila clavipes]|nr:hypothetical protein TNCV_3854981 [Trichonephila clavipes]